MLILSSPVFSADRGLYVSAKADGYLIVKPGAMSDFFSFLEKPFGNTGGSYNKVYWHINDDTISKIIDREPDMSIYNQLLSELHAKNVKVECVIDFTGWIGPQMHQAGLSYINSVLNFNQWAQSPEEAFDAIQLTAYPETLMTPRNGLLINDESSTAVWNNYISFLTQAKQLIYAYNQTAVNRLSFNVALSASYDNDDYTATFFSAPIELADEVILASDSRILASIKQNCENEIVFAQSAGKKISVCTIAKSYPSDPAVSFWGFSDNPVSYMNQVLYTGLISATEGSPDKTSVSGYFSKYQIFSGIAVDGYEPQGKGGYQELNTSVNAKVNTFLPGNGSGEINLITPADYAYYMPGFVNPEHTTSKQVFIMINLATTSRFYSLVFGNDSVVYNDNIAFVRNNQNNIMQPLEKGTLQITVNTALLPADMRTNLFVNVVPDNPTIIVKDPAVPVKNGVAATVPFYIGKVFSNNLSIPLTLNLYNANRNVMIYSQDVDLKLNMDDIPRGHLLTTADPIGAGNPVEPLVNVHSNVYIVSGDTIHINGWCFDDNNLQISVEYDEDIDAVADTSITLPVERYVHPINNYVPYWGATYPSGFRLNWTTDDSFRGYRYIKTVLDDGMGNPPTRPHRVVLDNDPIDNAENYMAIYWNKKPTVNQITEPASEQQFLVLDNQNFDEIVIRGEAIDVDVDLPLGVYLSCVELYVDSTTKIATIANNSPQYDTDSSYDRILYQFPYEQAYTLQEGSHTLYAVAKDSFGEQLTSYTIPFVIFKCIYPPVMDTVVSPRLGSWNGANTVVIHGTNLNCVDDVKFGANSATIVDRNDSILSVIVPQSSESKYVDIRLTNQYGSTFSVDGYRYIPATVNSISSDGFTDLKYNNNDFRLYLLNNITSKIEIFGRDISDPLNFVYEEEINCSESTAPLKFDLSKYGLDLSVIYNSSSILNIYNTQPGSLLYSIDLSIYSDAGAFASTASSVCFLMPRKILAGTSGVNAGLYLIEIGDSSYSCQQILPSLNYDSVEVFASANKAYSYILCKSISSNTIDIYRFDADSDSISLPLINQNLIDTTDVAPQIIDNYLGITANISDLKIAVNPIGAEWLLYNDNGVALFDKRGKLKSATLAYGANLAVYDLLRDIFYTEDNNNTSRFTLRSPANLDHQITFYQYPSGSVAKGLIDLSWNGEEMFVCASTGLSAVKIGDIYPKLEIEDTSRFALRNPDLDPNNTIQINVKNAGNIGSNIRLSVSDTDTLYSIINSSGTDHTLKFITPDSLDSLSILSSVYDYPSQREEVLMMYKLYDLIPTKDKIDLGLFIPHGLYYDSKGSDLYAYDSTKTAGLLSIARFKINSDNTVSRNKTNLSSTMNSIFKPTKITRANNYIMVVSNETKYAKWFNINVWDSKDLSNVEYNKIYSAQIIPMLTNITGVEGHPTKNIAYLWDNTATAGKNLYQLRWNPAPAPIFKGLCYSFDMTPELMDVLVENTATFGFATSSTTDSVNVFDPNVPSNQVVENDSLVIPGGPDQLTANSEYNFVSLKDTKGISIFTYPGKYVETILEGNPGFKAINYINSGNDFLVYAGKEPSAENRHTISLMDINIWNDLPVQDTFMTMYNKTYSFDDPAYDVRDTIIINNKLYAIIGRDIYIIDLPDRDN